MRPEFAFTLALSVFGAPLTPALAKVSTSLVLCVPHSGKLEVPVLNEKVTRFRSEITALAGTSGPAEVAISSSVLIEGGTGKSVAAPSREQDVLRYLAALGIEFGTHERASMAAEAKPQDYGCKASEVAVEIEVLFKHAKYSMQSQRDPCRLCAQVRPNPSLNPRPATAGAVSRAGASRTIVAVPAYSTCLHGRG